MDRSMFEDVVRDRWQFLRPDEIPSTELLQLQVDNALREGRAIFESPHWTSVAHRTMLELLNEQGLRKLLQQIRNITELNSFAYPFASQNWFYFLYGMLYRMYPFVTQYRKVGEVGDFFLRLTIPQRIDYTWYMDRYFASGFPIFTRVTNYYIRKRVQQDIDNGLSLDERARSWRTLIRRYYAVYFATFADIYILVSQTQPDRSRYKLLRPIGIAPDQRVFLAQELGQELGARRQVVVKWSDRGNETSLENWEKIRATGAKMLWFDATYDILSEFTVLMTEKLNPVSYRDNALQLARDVFQQLAVVHGSPLGPFVHSDIKLDNILVRVNPDSSREYFIIDWDNVSQVPWDGVRNAVERAIYSPIWTSQLSGEIPTSYRYDLQEFFYAFVDLFKKYRVRNWRSRNTTPVPLYMADSDTLLKEIVQRNITVDDIRKQMQVASIAGYEGGRTFFNLILDLPERAPVDQIDYSAIIAWLEKQLQSSSTLFLGQTLPTASMTASCAQCERDIDVTMSIETLDGDVVHVCGLSCAALQNEDRYHEEALARKQFTRAIRTPRSFCTVCGKTTTQVCVCGEVYCSTACQAQDYLEHKPVCVRRRETRLLESQYVSSLPPVQ